MNATDNLIMGQLEFYADRVAHFQTAGDTDLANFFRSQAQALLEVEDELEIMTLTYHRHMSPTGGAEFEANHGDPELFF
ncbi:hypothetical protein [Synechococcus phage S-N03]|uniref:Uncharacterized protein n=1 Tax=Synechococcus phage S-N03 TaxID=2718943 RepID=A0A6G8R5N1_9CAUD|nr:hypothetical protein PQC09_gp056 [Synechococcus phage S-N03]QIN96691.1 hypothetical protein [Synechococcus phage S-N03]